MTRTKPLWSFAAAAIVVGLGAGSIGVWALRSNHTATVPHDAGIVAPVAPVASALDAAAAPAAVPIDAAPALVPDAAVRPPPAPASKHRPRPHAPATQPDAGAALPDIDLIPTH